MIIIILIITSGKKTLINRPLLYFNFITILYNIYVHKSYRRIFDSEIVPI